MHKLINSVVWINPGAITVDIAMILLLVHEISPRVIHMFFEKLSMHFYTEKSVANNRRDYENNKSL